MSPRKSFRAVARVHGNTARAVTRTRRAAAGRSLGRIVTKHPQRPAVYKVDARRRREAAELAAEARQAAIEAAAGGEPG